MYKVIGNGNNNNQLRQYDNIDDFAMLQRSLFSKTIAGKFSKHNKEDKI